MASYLITGGCGFIGSHLADHLVAAGHRVRVPYVFDVCTGTPTSIGELALIMQDLCGVRVPLLAHPPRAGDIRWSLGSAERAAAHLGLRAQVQLRYGLRASIQSLNDLETKIASPPGLIDHAASNLAPSGLFAS